MPREAQALIRKGGFREAEKYFVLAYEGTVTEKRYFEALRSSDKFNDSGLIEMIPLPRPRNLRMGSNPNVVKSLLKTAKTDFNFRVSDEFWLIIDRDNWADVHHVDLDKLSEDCKREGNFYIAMSNPCFELWLLLHRTDFSSLNQEELQGIRENKRVSSAKHYIDTILAEYIGHPYTKRLKGEDFIPYVHYAIHRAAELHCEGCCYPKDLGSDVFLLVQKLVKEECFDAASEISPQPVKS